MVRLSGPLHWASAVLPRATLRVPAPGRVRGAFLHRAACDAACPCNGPRAWRIPAPGRVSGAYPCLRSSGTGIIARMRRLIKGETMQAKKERRDLVTLAFAILLLIVFSFLMFYVYSNIVFHLRQIFGARQRP